MILNITFLVFILKGDKIMELKEFVREIAKNIEAGLEGVKITPTESGMFQKIKRWQHNENCV